MENSNDLFFDEKKVEEKTSIPSNYTDVKLSSLGKLGSPKKLHVRNYTFEEALEMSEMTSANEKSIIIKILNEIIWEDLDAKDLHEQDAIEILLNVFAKWWSTRIEGFQYFVNEELEGEEKKARENISMAEIPISNIQTTSLGKEVKEPITISNDEMIVKLLVPKMKTALTAKEIVDDEFIEQEDEFQDMLKAVRTDKDYSSKKFQEYSDLQAKKQKQYLRYYQAQLIQSFNGVPINNIQEGLEALKKIDLVIWTRYNEVLENSFTFGVNPEVKFTCNVTGEEITRRFRFRPFHFLPSLESKDNPGYTVSFG